MPPPQVTLLVHNDKVARTMTEACQDRGAEISRAGELPEALDALASAGGGVLVLDLAELATKSDKKINATLASIDPSIKVLALGSGYDVKSVTSFYRSGLCDFLDLPLDPLLLSRALGKVLGSLQGNGETAAPSPVQPLAQPSARDSAEEGPEDAPETAVKVSGGSIVGRDPGLMKVFRVVEKVAATDSTVMIHGESGTGKELIARAIHQSSPRARRPLIPVNCGAIPEELLETELFGHEKGAFTNAIRDRTGRFEMADGGTIFLDEIGDMSPKLQVKLLRVIQEHEFERVGGDKTISVDIRIITATHVDLSRAVAEGRFREDLYYRLNVIPLTIPPLRARAGDVPLLVEFFLARLQKTRGSKVMGLAPEVMSVLKAYHWPGNIRELENLMERMVILADGPVLTLEDLPQRLLILAEGRAKSPPAPKTTSPSQVPEPEAEPADQPFWPDFSSLPGASKDPGQGPRRFAEAEADAVRPASPSALSARETLAAAGPDAASPSEAVSGSPSASGPDSPGAPAGAQAGAPAGDHSGTPAGAQASDQAGAPAGAQASDQAGAQAGALPRELAALVAPIMAFPERGVDLTSLTAEYEDRLIRAALKASSGVKNQAAKALGLSRTTFLDKLKKRGLD